jgi:hypothetical protein
MIGYCERLYEIKRKVKIRKDKMNNVNKGVLYGMYS